MDGAIEIFSYSVNIDDKTYSTSISLPNVIQHGCHFVDLVIPEIPYRACKKNSFGKHIIDRIPLDELSGAMIYYNSYNPDNYFYPISLNKLTIQLYEDSNNKFYDCQNNDNYFEFEITILNNPSI